MPTTQQRPTNSTSGYDVEAIRADFPILEREIRGERIAYLDNAASTQKPRPVLDAVRALYERSYSNVHRGVHALSQEATDAYEAARERVRRFIGAPSSAEIVFVRGTTEAINLVAQSYARPRLSAGDRVLLTHLEHHSNIVPWQLVCEATGAELVVAPIDDDGAVIVDEYERLLDERVRVVTMAHVSNALGTVNPVTEMTALARRVGAAVIVDGAQAAPHVSIEVTEIDCDFYAFSGHKVYGPTGIGVLWGRRELLAEMPPYQGGGEMISRVSFEGTTFREPPFRFEAGTPNIAGVVGLAAALDYVEGIGLERIAEHEHTLLGDATERLRQIEGVRIVGTAEGKTAVLSFVLDGVHAHDVGTVLDTHGVAVRAGHHCAQPVMDRFGVPATARASFGLYNTVAECERLAAGVERTREIFV